MDHAAMGHGAASDEPAWSHPPMLSETPMIPGLGHLRPEPLPFLPRLSSDETLPDAVSVPRRPASGTARTLDLIAGRVRRRIHGRDYVMYGFNGQYPGPLIHVDQDSTIFVNFENQTSWPTAIHWHGVRLDNAFDGVPNLTQDPVPPGGRFEYRIFFPDCRPLLVPPPTTARKCSRTSGSTGTCWSRPRPTSGTPPVHREEILMLDDLLIADDGGLFPWGTERATHSLMGRFGNLFLVNGEPDYETGSRPG